ncbi:hypothetical protein BKA63DRAFT_593961 [Paraphoma chrysanthemicola]|nr:hypothetical protein BKA63DRAFT_593961 [Paraphoma chrysanthemicola]
MAASPPPIEPSNVPAPPDISKPILPEDLVNYTGWFRTNAGARIVITRYCSQLSLGHIDGIHGEITRSYSLPLEGAMAMASPGDFTVDFGAKQGKITHVQVGEARYKRTERGVCLITTSSTETREMIWRYALGGALKYDGGEDAKWDSVILSKGKMTGEAIITGDLKNPWNLIRCVCKDFRNDAKLGELWDNTLMSNTSSITKLLRPRNVEVAHYLRRLILHFGWGGLRQPPQSQLFSILEFALSTPTCDAKVSVCARQLELLLSSVGHCMIPSFTDIGEFFPCNHEDVGGEDVVVCASQKKAVDIEDVVVRACRRKVMRAVRIWYNLGGNNLSSSDKILDEVEGWFRHGLLSGWISGQSH